MTNGEKNFGELDCISRADVIKLMQDNWHTHNGDWAMQESMDDIRALPSVTPQEPRWIPVSEKKPDEGYSVLVMRITDDNYKYMRVATYQGDCWMDDTDKFNKPNPHKVIAWMPLPQPYSEVEE